MRLHFIGIAGSFMSGLARLAIEMGHTVTGSDRAFYPPMGEEVRSLNIPLFTGYDHSPADCSADLYIVGNVVSRGNPLMEAILRDGLAYVSAAQWAGDNILAGRTVLAVAGTHGKTTTASLLAYVLDSAGFTPGFLLGGIARNFGVSARLSPTSPFFIIEADEYDSAFFDKRPKFLHYHPTIAIINNIEFDHADIYPDINAIIRQFHYLFRCIPDNGRIIASDNDTNIDAALQMGAYTPVERFGGNHDWQWRYDNDLMTVYRNGNTVCKFKPPLSGAINRNNILATFAAASAAGVDIQAEHINGFQAPLRRLQHIATINGVRIFDDFAHHPTAIQATIAALAEMRDTASGRIIAVFEPRSNSMKAGIFSNDLPNALAQADVVIALDNAPWLGKALAVCRRTIFLEKTPADIVARISATAKNGDDILLMSNGDFDGLAQKIKDSFSAN